MKQRGTAIFLAVLLVLTLSCGSAFAGIPDAPDPFYAADFANVLDAQTEEHIVDQNGILENLCGAQIVVVTTDFLDGMNIEDYAYKIFNDWKIGDSEKNNGVLLLLAIGEENYWCMQGKGLEKVLTSGDLDDILWDNLEEDFAAEDYSAGVIKTFDALYDSVYSYYAGTAAGDNGNSSAGYPQGNENYAGGGIRFSTVVKLLVLIFVIVLILSLIGSRGSRRRRNDYGGTNYGNRSYGGGPVFIPMNNGRRRRRPPMPPGGPFGTPPGGSRPRQPQQPQRRNPSGGGLFGGGSSHRSSGSFGGGHSSFGGGSRGSGRGGGGMSRGGGAGRRGR